MVNAVFYHKPDSIYDDRIELYYHFPKQYLKVVEQSVADGIVYYGPGTQGLKSRYYTATARVTRIRQDLQKADHFYADVADYIDFDRAVEYRENGGYEKRLVSSAGTISGGVAINAVRPLTRAEFAAIVEAGLSQKEEWPDRDAPSEAETDLPGLAETPQTFITRPIIETLMSRPFRDVKFRQNIRRVYDRTCAFTNLRLINGGGRPEVEAAHIIPVEEQGSDSIRNGIALSTTVHWMFDRGLLSLGDDFTILRSRHINHDISHILNANGKAKIPAILMHQPHSDFLRWHREHRFKG